MAGIKGYLDTIDPRLWYALLAVLAWGAIAVWKKANRKSFDRLPRAVRVLPATILAAAMGATAGANVTGMVIEAVLGGLSGVLAIGGQEVGSRLLSKQYRKPKKATVEEPVA